MGAVDSVVSESWHLDSDPDATDPELQQSFL